MTIQDDINYIVLDLEATCDLGSYDNEIIEIGAVKLNTNLDIIDEFSYFVKPAKNTILTSFCKELTSITQDDIDNASSFPYIIQLFIDWIGTYYNLISWGNYDKKQFIKDCIYHNIDTSWITNHINMKNVFAKSINSKRKYGLGNAIKLLNMEFIGTHHRGIDDAKNIVQIMKYMKEKNLYKFGEILK